MKTREKHVNCMNCESINEGCDKNCPFESSEKEIRDCSECELYSEGCEDICPFELPEYVAEKATSRLFSRKNMKAERSNAVDLAKKKVQSANKINDDAQHKELKEKTCRRAEHELAKAEERRQKRVEKNTK